MDPSGRVIKIGFISGFNLFTGVPGRIKYPIAPASAFASIFVIFNTDVEYAVSVRMGAWLLVTIVFHNDPHLHLWKGGQIFCFGLSGWGTTIFHMAVLDCFVFIFLS